MCCRCKGITAANCFSKVKFECIFDRRRLGTRQKSTRIDYSSRADVCLTLYNLASVSTRVLYWPKKLQLPSLDETTNIMSMKSDPSSAVCSPLFYLIYSFAVIIDDFLLRSVVLIT